MDSLKAGKLDIGSRESIQLSSDSKAHLKIPGIKTGSMFVLLLTTQLCSILISSGGYAKFTISNKNNTTDTTKRIPQDTSNSLAPISVDRDQALKQARKNDPLPTLDDSSITETAIVGTATEESYTTSTGSDSETHQLKASNSSHDTDPRPGRDSNQPNWRGLDSSDNNSSHTFSSLKLRRHINNPQREPDWWNSVNMESNSVKQTVTTLTTNTTPDPILVKHQSDIHRTKKTSNSRSNSFNNRDRKLKPPRKRKQSLYREQPLNQNAIMTMKYQLRMIKDQQRKLVMKSMKELQNLDRRLVESYKLCFKNKMPLYAGMLYRTREFVVVMANDVRRERQLLDSMTKKVQNSLDQKMKNITLVKEYKNLLESVRLEKTKLKNEAAQRVNKSSLRNRTVSSPRSKKDNSLQLSEIHNQQVHESYFESKAYHQDQDQSKIIPTAIPDFGKNIGPSQSSFAGSIRGMLSKNDVQSIKSIFEKASSYEPNAITTTKRPRYVVHINEVNLKRQLDRVADLVDRIEDSCFEISAVIDDIIYLFRLDSDYKGKNLKVPDKTLDKMGFNYSDLLFSPRGAVDPKRNKKLFRSPAKIYLDRFGHEKADDSTNIAPGTSTARPTNRPEESGLRTEVDFKPLFDPASLNYTGEVDSEVGFE